MQFCSCKNGLRGILADVCEMDWGLCFPVVRGAHAETSPSFLCAKPWKPDLGRAEKLCLCWSPRETEGGRGICRLHPRSTKRPEF